MAEPAGLTPAPPADDPAPRPEWLAVCAGNALANGGDGVRFELPLAPAAAQRGRQPTPAFVVRIDGLARAYVNRCAHVAVELDWQPGRFFDETGRFLVCATHGAMYDARTGACTGGPCRGVPLQTLPVKEEHGTVFVANPSRSP